MRRFDGTEEFLLALARDRASAPEVAAYLQSLKWVAQMREKVGERQAAS